jgi:peptide/nickel transport system substrate-binding protein
MFGSGFIQSARGRMGLVVAILVVLCATGGVAHGGFYGQAPMLAARVATDDLPSAEKRLPRTPAVIQPVDSPGRYGGTWRLGTCGDRDHALLIRTLGYENLVRWDPAWTRVIPNVASVVTVQDDSRTFIFRLREGLRWSDGAPFTADDILFWYEYVFRDPELTPSPPAWLAPDGNAVRVAKRDELTVAFRFSQPNGMFLSHLAGPEGAEPTAYPRHYLRPMLPAFNAEADAEARAAGFGGWKERFLALFGKPGSIDDPSRWRNPDLPTLNAWVLTQGYPDPPRDFEAVRNPYYWKVDTGGRQLPYIDRLDFTHRSQCGDLVSLALGGKLDMQNRHVGVETRRADFEAVAEAAGVRLFNTIPSRSSMLVLGLNLNHADPAKRTLFRTEFFRVALSMAIDRAELARLRFDRPVPGFQPSPRPESVYFDKDFSGQYTDHDPEHASHLLDVIGLTRTGPDGFRLLPDGRPLTLEMETFADGNMTGLEEIVAAWRAIGIDASVVFLSRDKLYAHAASGDYDAQVRGSEGGLDVILSPEFYVPVSRESIYAPRWAAWFRNPEDPFAEEPPGPVKRQMQLYREALRTGDAEVRQRLMREVLAIAAEQFYVIGDVLDPGGFGVRSERMANVPEVMPMSWVYPTPAPTNPCQYYIRQSPEAAKP